MPERFQQLGVLPGELGVLLRERGRLCRERLHLLQQPPAVGDQRLELLPPALRAVLRAEMFFPLRPHLPMVLGRLYPMLIALRKSAGVESFARQTMVLAGWRRS